MKDRSTGVILLLLLIIGLYLSRTGKLVQLRALWSSASQPAGTTVGGGVDGNGNPVNVNGNPEPDVPPISPIPPPGSTGGDIPILPPVQGTPGYPGIPPKPIPSGPIGSGGSWPFHIPKLSVRGLDAELYSILPDGTYQVTMPTVPAL